MLHAVAQNVDDAALADFALKPGKEFLSRGAVVVEIDLDGENVGQLPARFTMCRAALNMIVPAAP